MSTTGIVFTVLGSIVLAGLTMAYLSIWAIEKDSQINQAEPEPGLPVNNKEYNFGFERK